MSDLNLSAHAPELGDWALMKTGWATGADGQPWDQPEGGSRKYLACSHRWK